MTIAEVSKTFGLTADTLRYYERIGLIPPVKRSSSGIRDYDEKDCNWVEFIKCMRGVGTVSYTHLDVYKRQGFNVGGKIGIARCGEHLCVAIYKMCIRDRYCSGRICWFTAVIF